LEDLKANQASTQVNVQILLADSANQAKADLKNMLEEQMDTLLARLSQRQAMVPSSSPISSQPSSVPGPYNPEQLNCMGAGPLDAEEQADGEPRSKKHKAREGHGETSESPDGGSSTGRHRAAQTPMTQLVHTTIREVLSLPKQDGGLYV